MGSYGLWLGIAVLAIIVVLLIIFLVKFRQRKAVETSESVLDKPPVQPVIETEKPEDLTKIEGIQSLTALKIVSEIGTDMTKWPSAKHFASWLCLCPGNKITGGRRLSGRTTPSANRVATALRIAAQTLWRSKSALGAFLRRMAARHGMPKAITATAHRLARMIYSMLRYGTDYVMRSQLEYEQQHLVRRKVSIIRQAQALGLFVLDPQLHQQPTTPTPQPSGA